MNWLAKILFPLSERHDARRKLNVLVGVLAVGLLTAAVVAVGFYYFNRRTLGGH